MAAAGKVSMFQRDDNDWVCNAGLPNDLVISVDGAKFHLHKFPLISRCGKIEKLVKESPSVHTKISTIILEEFPGGADTFLLVAKFCYGAHINLTAKNIIMVYCAADYLEMTDDQGEDNLLSKSESFFHKNVIRNWKDCVLALQSSEPVIPKAGNLHLINKCMNAISMMVCTDRSLFGWPMMMYGSFQSPSGSILWNGINTGAKVHSPESNWWFEDVSYVSLNLFEKLIQTMRERGIRPENLAGAIMYYAKKYLPGLTRWECGQNIKTRLVTSFSPTPVHQKVLLESIVNLLPKLKGKSFCRFLLGLLRVALILGINNTCQESLERRIGAQLELATLDNLLIPSYSDSDTLYNTNSVERIIHHFTSLELNITASSPLPRGSESSPSLGPLRKVARLVDGYIAEVASDVNMKPGKIRALADAVPESSRSLHDGLYRAIDIYLKEHPWLSNNDKEQLCIIIDFQKLSIDACAHASQNERLPVRVVLQVLFFEQLQLRTALASSLQILGPSGQINRTSDDVGGQIRQRDGWVPVAQENQVLKGDLENMRSRVGELEEEFNKIKREMRKMSKSHSSINSPRFIAGTIGCRPISESTDIQSDIEGSASPRALGELTQVSRLSMHRKSFSLFGVS